MSSSNAKSSVSVVVCVRIRPKNQKELDQDAELVAFDATRDFLGVEERDEKEDIVKKVWPYDHVFGKDFGNEDIFRQVGAQLVDSALEGYNSVLFMYGQTSSGKTFTLFGNKEPKVAGLVTLVMDYLQVQVQHSSDTEYVIRMTYAELYNEELKDLLSVVPNENLKIVDDPLLGPQIQNITEVAFTSPHEMGLLLEEGEQRRHFGVTNMNAHSSRSHVLVRFHIEARKVPYKPSKPLRQDWGKDKPSTISVLNLVDLAGSERAGKSGTTGQSLKEGSFINKSLLTLGTVIASLSEGKVQHIPYRDSKLTRLLASALGGNARTCMITCISPAADNVPESLSTLRFASRAKRIVNQVSKNETQDAKSLVNQLALRNAELDELKHLLEMQKKLGFVPSDGTQGETLIGKAVTASKNFRSLKFLMKNTPKIIRELKKTGQKDLIKKISADLKAAVSGSRDILEVLDEHSTVVIEHLPHAIKLVHKVEELYRENEQGNIMGYDDGSSEGKDKSDHHHHHQHHEGAEGSEGEDDSDSDDEFDFGFGSGNSGQNEATGMSSEDFRACALQRINQLVTEAERSKTQRDTLLLKIVHQEESIKKLTSSEHAALKALEETKKHLANEQDTSAAYTEKLQNKISELESLIADRDSSIQKLETSVIIRDTDNEKLRSSCDKLNKDLMAANKAKKAFEDEVSRVKVDLRTQMDKLRNNMHMMLEKEGDESKLIEHQNMELQKDLDALNDALVVANTLKMQLESEANQLRSTLQSQADREKSHIEELQQSRDQNLKLSSRIQILQSECTQASFAHQASESSNVKIQDQLRDKLLETNQLVDDKISEIQLINRSHEAQMDQMNLTIEELRRDLYSTKESLESKSILMKKLEHQHQSEISKIEKKLLHQIKLNEDMTMEHQARVHSHSEINNAMAAEKKKREDKIFELQSYVDSVNQFFRSNNITSNSSGDNSSSSSNSGSKLTVDVFDEPDEDIWENEDDYERELSSSSVHQRRPFGAGSSSNSNSPSKSNGIDTSKNKNKSNNNINKNDVNNNNSIAEAVVGGDRGSEDEFKGGLSGINPLISRIHARVVEVNRSFSRSGDGLTLNQLLEVDNSSHFEDAERHQAILDSYYKNGMHDSAKFNNICQSIALATGHVKAMIANHAFLSKSMLFQYDSLTAAHQSQSNELEILAFNANTLTESSVSSKAAIDKYAASEASMATELTKLRELYQHAKKDVALLTSSNESLNSEVASQLRVSKQLTLGVESIRQEKEAVQNDLTSVSQELTILKAEVEEFSSKYMYSQNELSKLEQDFAVIEAERDELYRQFIRNKAPALTIATSSKDLSGYYNALDSVRSKTATPGFHADLYSGSSFSSGSSGSSSFSSPIDRDRDRENMMYKGGGGGEKVQVNSPLLSLSLSHNLSSTSPALKVSRSPFETKAAGRYSDFPLSSPTTSSSSSSSLSYSSSNFSPTKSVIGLRQSSDRLGLGLGLDGSPVTGPSKLQSSTSK